MATTKITTPDLFDLSTVNTALRLPNGSTGNRPSSPSNGEWRYNTTLKYNSCDKMRNKKIKLSGMMFAGMIIVISFVYAINIQPVVFGEPGWYTYPYKLNQFDSYKDLTDFLYKNQVPLVIH